MCLFRNEGQCWCAKKRGLESKTGFGDIEREGLGREAEVLCDCAWVLCTWHETYRLPSGSKAMLRSQERVRESRNHVRDCYSISQSMRHSVTQLISQSVSQLIIQLITPSLSQQVSHAGHRASGMAPYRGG